MNQPRSFGSFELAPNDRLWVQPTSMYGLLNLIFDPVGWVAGRNVDGRPAVLESPYVINFEPHASDFGIPANQILVQGIDGTGVLTVHAGPAAGTQLMEHVHAAPHFQAFEQAAMAGAASLPHGPDEAHTDNFRKVLLPALFRVLHRTDLDQPVPPSPDAETLFKQYKAGQMSKPLDATLVHSSGQGRDFLYVHFPIWPNPGSLGAAGSTLTPAERLAEKMAEVALFHYTSVTDPTFLTDVMNGAKLNGAPSSYTWSAGATFTLSPGGGAPSQFKFALPGNGLRLVHFGREHPADPSAPGAPAPQAAPENACEILIGAPQPNGTVVLHEAYCKPYE